jgi:AraC family transcriptional regulator
LCLVLEGGFRERTGRLSASYTAGAIVFRPGGEGHADDFGFDGARCFNLSIAPELISRAAGRPGGVEALRPLLRRLRRELRGEGCSLVMEGLIYQTVGELFRRGHDERRPPAWLAEVDRMVAERFAERLTLASVAAELQLHPVHVSRLFRRLRRRTIGEAVRLCRVDFAQRLLGATEMPLAEVALRSGFADQAQFTKAFRRVTGTTPAAYRTETSVRRPSNPGDADDFLEGGHALGQLAQG